MVRILLRFFVLLIIFCGFLGGAQAQEILTWKDCLQEAQKNHPDLISAQESIQQSRATKTITASTLFPQIDSSVTASRAKSNSDISNSFSYGVSGTQLLFDGLKTTSKVRAASENLKAAQYQYQFVSSEVRYRLRSAFINLLRAQKLVEVTQEIVELRKNNLVLITLSYESGLEHKGAVLTAEANLAQAELERAQAQRNLQVVARQLHKEMGRKDLSLVKVEGDFVVAEVDRSKPDFEALAKNNPSLQKLNAQENAAAIGVKTSYGDFFPHVSASGGTGEKGSTWPPENDQWNAGLSLTFPLFQGGARIAEVAKAKAAYRQVQADKRSARDDVLVTLEESWMNLQDTVDKVGVQKKFLEAAEARAKISEGQYSLGLIQFDNWIIIENDLVNAKKSFLDSQANALLAEAHWIYAKGETLEYAE